MALGEPMPDSGDSFPSDSQGPSSSGPRGPSSEAVAVKYRDTGATIAGYPSTTAYSPSR